MADEENSRHYFRQADLPATECIFETLAESQVEQSTLVFGT
jgi:hypothetical protein